MDEIKGLFKGRDTPDPKTGWEMYDKALSFNASIRLNDTVNVNENFYIGKQWEGVESNGLPTPQFNFLKRVVGFIVATITTDNIKVTASPLSNNANVNEMIRPAQIINNEFEALAERNKVPALMRVYARNAAVDADGCLYSYWDEEAETGQDAKGAIRTEVIENTRVFFGNPNSREVQSQPWIMISSRESTRTAKKRAKKHGGDNWEEIKPDTDQRFIDSAKIPDDDKVTVLLLLWRSEETGTIWAYEFTENCTVKKAWDLGLRLYPVCWLNWDYVQDCYHGQAMITGLIPNQIFVNKIWALSMLSFLKTAYPKYIYDNTRIKRIDNRVGGAIGVAGGDINNAIKILDPATISPQIAQFIELAVSQTEESLGATSVALGDTRPDNTSAIIALQRAASTPTELTKQNLYGSIEDLHRIYIDFMAEYYGTRMVDVETPEEVARAYEFAGMPVPDSIQVEFDFSTLKSHPMTLKLDVGASSYYSEIASMQTLDNLLRDGHIDILQYLERIPDGYIPGRRALIAEIQRTRQMQMGLPPEMGGPMPPTNMGGGGGLIEVGDKPEIPTGGGFSALQRKVLEQGTTEGLV